MRTIAQIVTRILDVCEIPAGKQRDCLECEIAKAIAADRHELNDQVQGAMAEFRMVVETTLLPKGLPKGCGGCNERD